MADTKHNITYTNSLVPGHAYAVLGAYKLSNGVRLVKMANPWGVDSYTGDWSDTSSKWTTTLRNEVGSTNNDNDGVFFQTVEQLQKDWSGIYTNKNVSGWKKSSWLNLGRDIKSSSGGTSWFCKTANCRANKFNLDSAVDQQIYIGIGLHDERDYVGCTLPSWENSIWQYAKVPAETHYSMFNYGTNWLGPYTIKAGSSMPLNLEMDLLTAPLKNEWSVIVYGEKGEVKITHSDGYASDAWPVQQASTSSGSTSTTTNTTTTTTDTVTPTPTPTPTGNEIDLYVADQLLASTYTNNCSTYKSASMTSTSGTTYKHRRWWGHGCTTKSLKLQIRFVTTQKNTMSMITTQNKAESCSISGSYTTCTYVIKGGAAN